MPGEESGKALWKEMVPELGAWGAKQWRLGGRALHTVVLMQGRKMRAWKVLVNLYVLMWKLGAALGIAMSLQSEETWFHTLPQIRSSSS